MLVRLMMAQLALVLIGSVVAAQSPVTWKSAVQPVAAPTDSADSQVPSFRHVDSAVRQVQATSTVRSRGVTQTDATLPNSHGQVFRTYDIRPYTQRINDTEKPQQAVIDWVLRETGTDIWFSEPLGFLSASREKLTVYHTPEVQEVVRAMVDRLVDSRAQSHGFGVKLITVGSPNWRSTAMRMLRPVPVQTPGIQAWLLTKEDAAVLLADLRKRTDFREHNSSNLVISNGQMGNLAVWRPRSYLQGVTYTPGTWPGYQTVMGKVEEGFGLELSPLLSLDGKTIDAVIKCQVDQVEKMVDVPLNLPSVAGQRQKLEIQVPQLASWRLHERFRWPRNHVLLVSCGVVARPGEGKSTAIGFANPFKTGPPRADGLMFLESKGNQESNTVAGNAQKSPPSRSAGVNYGGRY